MKAKLSGIALIAVLTLCSCVKENQSPVLRGGSDPVIAVEHTDPEMNAAIQKAKDTVGQFVQELSNPKGRTFSIKTPIMGSEGSPEHVWVRVTRYEGGTFFGMLDSDPLDIPRLKLGDPMEVRKYDITDWMIFDPKTKKRRGGYTAEVLSKRTDSK